MSSFRPDLSSEFQGFVPLSLSHFDERGEGFRAEEQGSDSESLVQTSEHTDGAEADQGPSPEEIAALEAAAFDRGVAAERVSTDRLIRACETLESAAKDLDRLSLEALAANRESIVELALTIASSWVGKSLEADSSLYAEVLERALATSEEESAHRLYLETSDLARLESEAGDRVAIWRDRYRLELVADPELGLGAFRIEAGGAAIDGRPERVCQGFREQLATSIAAATPEEEA